MSRNVDLETNILWLEDGTKHPYVREFGLTCTAKRGWRKTWACGFHVVAIAELSGEARTVQRRLYRRAWFVKDDVDPYQGKDKPSEAVIPESIAAGLESTYGRK